MDTNICDKFEVYEMAREEIHAYVEEIGRNQGGWFIDRVVSILETRALWHRVHPDIAGYWYAEVVVGVIVTFIAVTMPGTSYREAGVSHQEIVSLERVTLEEFRLSKDWTLADVSAINREVRDRVSAK